MDDNSLKIMDTRRQHAVRRDYNAASCSGATAGPLNWVACALPLEQ